MDVAKRFESFVQSGLYLRGWSTKTPVIYRRAFASFQQSLRCARCEGVPPSATGVPGAVVITKAQLEIWIVWMRQRGLSPAGVNMYIRAMNAFCSWLKEQGDVSEHIVLKQLKYHLKPVTVFSPTEIKTLLANKPKRFTYLRTWIMIALMLDTGCRIDEVLGLEVSSVDLDNLLITVHGKGSKVRRIPFSVEMRKHLFRYLQKHEGRFVFSTRSGTRVSYRNAYRNIKLCFKTIGIEGEHVHPHNLRHSFACNFVKRGGSIFMLSRILGHSSVTTTQGYLRGLQVEDLTHHSPLGQF